MFEGKMKAGDRCVVRTDGYGFWEPFTPLRWDSHAPAIRADAANQSLIQPLYSSFVSVPAGETGMVDSVYWALFPLITTKERCTSNALSETILALVALPPWGWLGHNQTNEVN